MFENSSKIVIVMEYASRGDLYDYVSEQQPLSEHDARHFFRQIVSAVHYCHQVGTHLPQPCSLGVPGAPGLVCTCDLSRMTQGNRSRNQI